MVAAYVAKFVAAAYVREPNWKNRDLQRAAAQRPNTGRVPRQHSNRAALITDGPSCGLSRPRAVPRSIQLLAMIPVREGRLPAW